MSACQTDEFDEYSLIMSPAPIAVEPLYRAIGARIRARRRELRLSQDRLAEASGLSRGSISNVEAGRQQLYIHHLVAIADILEEDPRAFLEGLRSRAVRDPLSDLDDAERQFVEAAKMGATR